MLEALPAYPPNQRLARRYGTAGPEVPATTTPLNGPQLPACKAAILATAL